MTDPTTPDPPAGPPTDPTEPVAPAGPRRLFRSRGDRVLGGVAGGLGRHFDVDPVVFRIGFAALAIFGGAGIFIYLAALLFVPAEGDAAGVTPPRRSRVLTVAGAVVLVVAAIAAFGENGFILGPLVPLAILGGIGYALYRAVRGGRVPGSVTAGRVALWIAVGAGAVLALSALAIGAGWAAAEGSGAVVAAIVIALGAVLAISALRPRGARWLVLPALAIAVPLGVVSAADVRFDGGFGEREYRPVTAADIPADGYRVGAGAISVDLRDTELPAGGRTVLDLRVGVGAAEVFVPDDVCVETESRFGAGAASITGRESAGLDVDLLTRAEAGARPRLLIRADVGLGAMQVTRGDMPGPIGERDEGWDGWGDAPPEDAGCTITTAEAG